MPDADVASVAGVAVAQACTDLLELLAGVSDGRSSRGRDHPAAVVLALVAAATVAGMAGYTAMAGWVADVPQPVLTDRYLRVGASPVDLLRLDGKTVRGAVDADGSQVQVLAAVAGSAEPAAVAVVIGQSEVTGAKTNEPEHDQTIRHPRTHIMILKRPWVPVRAKTQAYSAAYKARILAEYETLVNVLGGISESPNLRNPASR